MSNTFDWYLSPSDKFRYEEKWNELISTSAARGGVKVTLGLSDLDILFHEARLDSQTDFLLIWHLLDLRGDEVGLNKTQFILFMHCISQRRRGFAVPVGLPLNLKQEILASLSTNASSTSNTTTRDLNITRPNVNVRDVGASLGKSVADLKAESLALDNLLVTTKEDTVRLESQLSAHETASKECTILLKQVMDALAQARSNSDTSGYSIDDIRRDLESLQNDSLKLNLLRDGLLK